jgi:hypothetical protein
MRTYRMVAVGALAATMIGAAGPSIVGAAAADPTTGVGTTTAATSVLELKLGDGSLLDLRLGGEDSQSTIDKKTGPTSAFTRLVPLSVTSKAVSALNTALPALEARAPGGSSNVPAVSVPLSTPASTGSLDVAALTAAVSDVGAKSGLNSALNNLALAGGLVSVPNLTSTLGTDALTTAANGVRGVKADSITVLDLGALLDGLGLNLTDLPVDVLSQLLGQLGLPVPGLDPGTTLLQAQQTLTGAIGQVQGIISSGVLPSDPTGTVGTIVGTVDGVLGDLTGGTGSLLGVRKAQALALPDIPSTITSVTQLVPILNQLNLDLSGLLGNALGVLDSAPLLQVKGLNVGLATTAKDTVANSLATITAQVGQVLVGTKSLGGVDLGAAASQVTGLVNTVTGTLSSVLGTIDPGLANLVSVKMFEQTKSVAQDGDYSKATAALSALTATITPPAQLAAIVSKVQGLTGVTDLVSSLGLPALPALPGVAGVSQLESVLGNVQALAQGATLRVASLSSTSEFSPAAVTAAPSTPGAPAATPAGELPRTGGDGATYAVFGVLLLAAALALVRWLRRPVIEL